MSEYAPEYGPNLGPYNQQTGVAENHTERLVGKLTSLALGLGSVRAVAGGAAADFQHMSSGMAAASAITGQSFDKLSAGAMKLQRDFPMATKEALATVQAVQSLGLTSRSQVGQVAALSQVMTKLGGANAIAPSQMAQGFGQLNREMASLDPARVQRFGDSLTTLAAKSGTSAMGIINFSQAISPFAQAAGVGQAAVLGISTAFAKLGNDGYVAANTVNKMFADLNSSVNEGSNQMAAYANILGVTTKQFKEMFKTDPANVIGQVTQRIGTAGPAGQRMLNSIGIEGIRGTRSLLLASQSGGLPAEIKLAESSYGSGSTQAAASAAYGGVTDQLTRLGAATAQVAQAFERPLLHSVSQVVHATAAIPRSVTGIVGSGPVQGILGATGQIAIPLLAARLLMRTLGIAATGTYLGGSGPVRGFLGGIAAGKYGGAANAAQTTGLLARAGAPFYEAEAQGRPMGSPFMLPFNTAAIKAGSALGALMGPPGAGPGLVGVAARAGISGVGLSLRYHAELARLGRLGPLERDQMRMSGYSGPMERFAAETMKSSQSMQAGLITRGEHFGNMQRELGILTTRVKGMSLAALTWQEGVRGSVSVLSQYSKLSVKGLQMGLGGLARFATSPAMLLTGGIMAYQGYQSHQAAQHAENQRVENLGVYDTLNRYRDAMGLAGEATTNFAAATQNAADVVNRIGGSSYHNARHVSGQDVTAAGSPDRNKATTIYRGSDSQVAGQISALNLKGLGSKDLQAVKMDLLKQGFSVDRVNSILAQVDTKGSGKGALTSTEMGGFVGGLAAASKSYSVSLTEGQKRSWGKANSPSGNMSDWDLVGSSKLGGTPLVGKDGQKVLDRLQDSLLQQYGNLSDAYGQGYAVSKQVSTAQKLLKQAIATGDPDTVAAMGQRLSTVLTGKKVSGISAADIKDAGGDISKLLADRNLDIQGHKMSYWLQHSNVARQNLPGGDYTMMKAAGATALLPYFDASKAPIDARDRQAHRLALSALANPENYAKQTRAVESLVTTANAAGTSLAELAHQATKAGGAFADGSPQQLLMAKVVQESQFRLQGQLQGATRAQTWQRTSQFALGQLQTNGNSQWAQQQREQGRELLQQNRGEMISYYQQRLMAQYQYQIQSERSQEDYHRQLSRSESDFRLNTQRQQEDFDRQMSRARQDAAATLYNPYDRIAVQPTWDAFNLAGNVQSQIQAMRQQVANIKKLRALGLDERAIQMLKLYDPNNAQEAQQLVQDLESSHGQAGVLNRQADQRIKLAGQLLSEDPQYRRQRDDFNRQMQRQRDDFNRQTNRAHTDFEIGQARMAQDVRTQDLELTNNLQDLQKGMNDVLAGNFVDFSNIVEKTMKHTLQTVHHWLPKFQHDINSVTVGGGGASSPTVAGSGITAHGSQRGGGYGDVAVGGTLGSGTADRLPGGKYIPGQAGSAGRKYVKPDTGTVYTGSTRQGEEPTDAFQRKHPADPAYNMTIAKAMKPEWAHGKMWKAWHDLWMAESGWNQYDHNFSDPNSYGQGAYGIPQAYPGHKMSGAGKDWMTNPATQIKWGIHYIESKYTDPLSVAEKMGLWSGHYKGYASGGIAVRPHLGAVAEAGNPEAMIPLNEIGVSFVAQVMSRYLTDHDAALITGGGGRAYAVHIDHSVHHYDQRVDFRGSTVEVKADSARELGHELEQRARAANLTATRGVKWPSS